MAAIDQVSLGETTYELVPEIAPLFDNTKEYAIGDYVIKDAALYKFKAAHAAGAWVGTDAEVITVGNELTNLKADLNDKASKSTIAPEFDSSASYTAGQYVYKNGVLYKFTSAHSGAWTGTDAEEVTVGKELTDLNESVTNLKSVLPIEDMPSVNLYDNSNPTILKGFLGTQNGRRKFSASNAARTLIILCEANTTYVISKSSTVGGRFSFALFEDIPADQDLGDAVPNATDVQDGRTYATFATGSTNLYFAVYYFNNSDGIPEADIRSTLMLTKGTTLYPYTPYETTKMLIIGKENISYDGTVGQTLMIGQDGKTLEWGTPSATLELDSTLTDTNKAAQAKATGDAITSVKSDLENQIGQVVLTQGVQDWLDDHPEAMIVIKRNGDAESTPTLGSELIPSVGWTSDGWTGDVTNGFAHTAGNTNPLTVDIDALETGSLYQFEITTSDASTNGWSDFRVSLGGSDIFETYKGGGALVSYVYGLICGSTKVLTITPRNDYTGTVTGLSLKKVSNSVGTQYELYDTNSAVSYQIRTVSANKDAIYQGENSGRYAFWGYGNASMGDNAMRDNTSGFWNTAIGHRALEANQNGSRNVAIGYIALLHNTGGDRNVAVGTFALEKNTTGRGNVAINADAMQDNTTGSYNVGIGVRALVGNTTGRTNVAVGDSACAKNGTSSGNVGIGHNALTNNTGSNNVAVGNNAGDASGMSGNNNIVIGYNTDVPEPTGDNQMVLGNSSISTVVIAGKTISFNADKSVTWS